MLPSFEFQVATVTLEKLFPISGLQVPHLKNKRGLNKMLSKEPPSSENLCLRFHETDPFGLSSSSALATREEPANLIN